MICNIYTCTMESAKYYWGKSTTTKINREVHHSHGQNITAKMLILSNWSTDAINSNQNPSRIFSETDKLILNFMKMQKL